MQDIITTNNEKEINKKLTLGKRLGLIAFLVSELLVLIGAVYCIFSLFSVNNIDSNTFSAVLMFQGTIFVTVWGAKASSNFAKGGGGGRI